VLGRNGTIAIIIIYFNNICVNNAGHESLLNNTFRRWSKTAYNLILI